MALPIVLVAACALVDTDGRVLLAKRPQGKPLAGLWEFPGGKVEDGERPEDTLIRELREELEKSGATFGSETDTEVVAHLVTEEMKKGRSPVEAVKAALPRLRGAFALAFVFAGEDDLLIGARQG